MRVPRSSSTVPPRIFSGRNTASRPSRFLSDRILPVPAPTSRRLAGYHTLVLTELTAPSAVARQGLVVSPLPVPDSRLHERLAHAHAPHFPSGNAAHIHESSLTG